MSKKNNRTDQEFTIEETILIERLRSFRVPAMVEEYKSQLQDPNSGLLSFEERFPNSSMRNGLSGTTRNSTTS